MSRVSFYFNVKDRELALCQLAGKAMNQGLTLGILTESASAANSLDDLLWRIPETGFIPHCMPAHSLATQTPVIVSHQEAALPIRDVLFNVRSVPCEQPERFGRVIEIVALNDEPGRDAARQRVRHYQAAGLAVDFTDMATRNQ